MKYLKKEILKEANSIIELEFNPWKDHVKEEEFSDELEGKDNLIQASIKTFQATLINDDGSEADNESKNYCNIVIYIYYKGISDTVKMENKSKELVDRIIKLKIEFYLFIKFINYTYTNSLIKSLVNSIKNIKHKKLMFKQIPSKS